MPVDELEVETYLVIGRAFPERSDHTLESRLADQRSIARMKRVAGAHVRQVVKQLTRVVVTNAQPVDIEDRIAEPGPHERVTDVMHVWKPVDVRVLIDARPGIGELVQAVRTQRREGEHPAFPEHPGYLAERQGQVIDPGQQLVREYDIEAVIGERQSTGIRLHAGSPRKPARLAHILPQHRVREIERDYVRPTEAFPKQRIGGTGRAAEIQDRAGVDHERRQARDQPFACNGMHEISCVEAVGRPIESPPHIADTQSGFIAHCENVSRFVP